MTLGKSPNLSELAVSHLVKDGDDDGTSLPELLEIPQVASTLEVSSVMTKQHAENLPGGHCSGTSELACSLQNTMGFSLLFPNVLLLLPFH